MDNLNQQESLQGGLTFKGIWRVELYDEETGEKVLDHTQDNIIVDNAIVYMAQGFGPADFTMLHVGNDQTNTPTNVGMLGLLSDVNTAGYATTHTPAITPGVFAFQKKATIPASDTATQGQTLTEAGLFTPGGVMFNRILFSPSITKAANQTAYITTTIQIRRA